MKLSGSFWRILVVWCLGSAASEACLKFLPVPFVWIAVCWMVCFAFAAAASRREGVKSAYLMLAVGVLCLGMFEGYTYWTAYRFVRNRKFDVRVANGGGSAQRMDMKKFDRPDETLGYAPPKGASVQWQLSYGAKTIYDVTYTIGGNGLRITPPARSERATDCALFFGDSFLFGEGVEDRESMPYVVGEISGYAIYNFGFHGYGPHQMLAALQSGRVKSSVTCEPRTVIYEALEGHASRSAGHASWDQHGPKYVWTEQGLRNAGHFDDAGSHNSRGKFLENQLRKSFIYQEYFADRITQDQVKVFVEIVDQSRAAVRELYPKAVFHVLFWNPNPQGRVFRSEWEGLKAKGIDVRLISDALPGYAENKTKYLLPYDGHPNPLGQRTIAEYVSRRILSADAEALVQIH